MSSLTEVRFWAQVVGDARRTIVCSPDLESRIKGWLSTRDLLGFHSVEVNEYMPDDRIFVVNSGAINAYLDCPATVERFAAVGSEDTPGFTALLDEFPTLSSRGNLKVILWRLAAHLRAGDERA